ncbi:putative transmembrane protein [Stenotrophomonas maltophilia K279a]|uniref:Transmembrane protein n=2 Tax=Stenotrophomonas maltophilia TaxID=40324 RepID=B2FLC0_STRMK|nr:putative transmembrane protein [Stenotrophomonas maltophilia K279a]
MTTPAISWGRQGVARRRAGVIVAYNTSHLRQGEAMNARIRRNLTAPAAAAVSTLIVLAWLATPTAPASPDSAQDAIATPAGNADSSPPPPRRLHSSLSMPYFSFAQPLTPRS